MGVATVTMLPRFPLVEDTEVGTKLDDFGLGVVPRELVVLTTGTVIDFW